MKGTKEQEIPVCMELKNYKEPPNLLRYKQQQLHCIDGHCVRLVRQTILLTQIILNLVTRTGKTSPF